jgi:hypothetical protein
MIALRQQDNHFILEFSKQDVSDEFLKKLINKYKLEQVLAQNEMSEEDAWRLSEEIKEDWIQENQSWILEKIEVSKNESDS